MHSVSRKRDLRRGKEYHYCNLKLCFSLTYSTILSTKLDSRFCPIVFIRKWSALAIGMSTWLLKLHADYPNITQISCQFLELHVDYSMDMQFWWQRQYFDHHNFFAGNIIPKIYKWDKYIVFNNVLTDSC